jgi:hypothetical protein
LKHHCQQLFPLSSLLKHHCQQPFTIFPIAETPLSATFHHFPHYQNTIVSFSPITKTPLFNNSSLTKQHRLAIVSPFFPLLKHPCQQPFSPFSPIAETPVFSSSSHFFINETTPSSNCFALLSIVETPLPQQYSAASLFSKHFSILPTAETPTFRHFLSISFCALILHFVLPVNKSLIQFI